MKPHNTLTINWIRAYHATSEEGMECLRLWLKTFQDAGRLSEVKPCVTLFPWNVVKIQLPDDYPVTDARDTVMSFGVPKGCLIP